MSLLNASTPQPRTRNAVLAAVLCLALTHTASHAQSEPAGHRESIRVVSDGTGSRLQVDGKDFLVRGMNWDYTPIGQNYAFDLWQQPDDMITTALDREMSLLVGMGANAIRVYTGIPPRWVRYTTITTESTASSTTRSGGTAIPSMAFGGRRWTTRHRGCAKRSPPMLPRWCGSTRTAPAC